ncbi:hypothetical protein K502DRAFT_193514 [Neoconidiobolus thromboides FSU 785]|nr:hypothetical protein K502DRAFT_193514 [Neoconidiobolus thromboides FSU 785]
MTDEQYSTQSYTDDIDIKTFKDWDLDLSNLPPLLKDTISLIKKVQADKYNLKQHPSLSNLKLNFRFSQFEIKNIISKLRIDILNFISNFVY